MVSPGKGTDHGNMSQRERSFALRNDEHHGSGQIGGGIMNIQETIMVISLVAAIGNGIGMTLGYLWIIRVIRGAFAALTATPGGEVEIVASLTPFAR